MLCKLPAHLLRKTSLARPQIFALRRLWRTGTSAPPTCASAFRLAEEELPLIDTCGHGNIKESNHHLVVGLITPLHRTVWVGIVGIIARVVIPGDRLQLRSRFQESRLCQPVTQLPIKVIVHAEQSFDPGVRM